MAAPSPMARFQRDPIQIAAMRGPDPDSLLGDERGLAWAEELTKELEQRCPIVKELREYKDGVQPIKFATEAWKETYGEDFGMVTDNWCEPVVEAVIECKEIIGFRFGQAKEVDQAAWDHWQRNRMDLDSDSVHEDAVVTGYGYAMVWKGLDGLPEITHEDPANTIVETDPANRRRRIAGMKRWQRRDGQWEAIVFTPDTWWRVETHSTSNGGKPVDAWHIIENTPLRASSGPNTLNVVPIVEFTNKPNGYGDGTSSLLPVLPLQDAVNKLFSDQMVVAEHAGYPQRVLLGFEAPQEDETDEDDDSPDAQPTEPSFRGGKNRWMGFEGEKARIQELQTADLQVFGKSIDQIVSHIAAITRTPAYLFPGGLINISAETVQAANDGRESRVKRSNKRDGEGWEEVMRLVFKIAGEPEKAAATSAETVWVDPAIKSQAQLVDALTKLRQSLELPLEFLWERYGMTPQEIERALAMRADEVALDSGISGPSGLPNEDPAFDRQPQPQPVA